MFIILKRKQKSFSERNTVLSFGIFYIGLKDKFFFWEILLMNLRKIVTTGIAVSIPTNNVQLSTLSCMAILFVNS
jgi:hypothetical protein